MHFLNLSVTPEGLYLHPQRPPNYQSPKLRHSVAEVAKPCYRTLIVSTKWLAVYTRPRWEKKVSNLLIQKGIESYCPLNKVHRKWSDRIKLVEEPLFKSYVFVKVNDELRTNVRMTDGVINFVYWNGKPAVVKEKEIESIKKFLGEHTDVELVPMELKLNEKVLVTSGPLMHQEGKVLELKNKYVKILIESLGYHLVANVARNKLSPLHLAKN